LSNNDYKFDTINTEVSFPNTLDLTHAANASLTYNLSNFKIGLGINWHSGRPYTKPSPIQNTTNSTIDYNSPNSSRLNDYFRTDISAVYNFNLSKDIKAELGASVWNIFNQTNIINRHYALNINDDIVKIDNQSLQLTPNLSFRVNF
jgi:hypothetical protein